MATTQVKDPTSTTTVAGTVTVQQAIHDSLNGNANLQVADVDVSNSNPVPMSDAGSSLTVDQSTHDNLNCNANVQVNNLDVSSTNPLPVHGSDAVGAAATDNPFMLGVQDTSGNVRRATGIQVGSLFVLGMVLPNSAGTSTAQVSNAGLQVTGDEAHDAADDGNPIKTGGKAFNLDPSSTGEKGQAEVAANDRVNQAMNLRGEIITACKTQHESLTALNNIFDTAAETVTSATFSCFHAKSGTFSCNIVKSGTPTDILFDIEVSPDGTNFFKLQYGPTNAIIESNASIGTGGTSVNVTFPLAYRQIRVKATSSGTDGSNTITVSESFLTLQT